jgi:hypothetical protein
MLKSTVAPVIKYVDTAISFTPTTGIYSNLSPISMPTTGTTANTCAGDAIKILKIEVHLTTLVISSASFDSQNIRSFIVQNVQPASTALAITDIFDNTGSAGVNSPLSYSEKGTVFKVCSKEYLYGVSTVWNSVHGYTYTCKPKIQNCRYGSTWETGTPVLVHVFSGLQVSSEVTTSGYVRLWFTDVA